MDAAIKLEDEPTPEPVYQLLYISAGTKDFSEPELEEILAVARENNKLLNITGMLLYHEGSFIQALEGDKAVVEKLYQKIGKDQRHLETKVLYRGDVPDRDFRQWSMGFYRSNQSAEDNLEGFHTFLRSGFRRGSKEDEGTARKAMKAFREGKWHAAD